MIGDQGARATPWSRAAEEPWKHRARRFVAGAFVTLVTVLAFTLVKLAFSDVIGTPTPFLLYFGAIVVAAWYGGWWLGLIATFVGAWLGFALFSSTVSVPPTFGMILVRTGLFVVEGLAITALTAALRRERERALVESRTSSTMFDELRAVFDAVEDGVTVHGRDGRLVYANASAARLCGFATPQALLAVSLADFAAAFDLSDEDGQPLPHTELPARAVLEGRPWTARVVRVAAKATGEVRFAELRASPVRDGEGRLLYAVNVFRDITEGRRKDEALRVGREWFSMALRSVGDAVVATDADGTITFVNPVAEALTGWSSAEALGRPLGDVFRLASEGEGNAIESPVARVLRDGHIAGLAEDTVLVARDGRTLAIDDSAAPIRDGHGRLVGTILVFRDVSGPRRDERLRRFIAQASAELSSSLEYERTLATVARLAVPSVADWCAVDILDGDELRRLAVAHVDPAKIELVHDIERRFPPAPSVERPLRKVLRTGEAEFIPVISPALLEAAARGPEHLALLRQLDLRSYIAVPLKFRDRAFGVISMATAESRRFFHEGDLELARALADCAAIAVENARLFREAERASADAQAQRDRLHDLVMHAPTAIAVLKGKDHVFELVNEPYRALSPDGELVGRPIADIDPEGQRRALLDRVRATGQPVTLIERAVTDDFGRTGVPSTRYFDVHIQPLRIDHEDALVSFTTDVTEKVLARQRLEAARAEAELASRAKDEFLAMLGHELRNPLSPILTALEIMKLRAGDAFARERSIVERQVKHVVRLVDDLLDVSRITRGKVELTRVPVELADVIAKAIEMASPLIEQREHALVVSVRKGIIVEGDAIRLAQVFANLLTNAAKYTERRGRIEVTAVAEGGTVGVTVGDNGMGIVPELLPRVFDLFSQGSQPLDRSQGGLGLGLAIVKTLVELHGGRVSAESAGVRCGSRFRVELPLHDVVAARAPTPVEGIPVARERRGASVLVVDDNADALEMLAEALATVGHDVHTAKDGPSALVTAAAIKPALAVLDIGLPVMDGYELARRLREMPGLDGIKLVAVTGYGQSSDRDRATAAGFDAHLVKPVSLDNLERTIGALVPSEDHSASRIFETS